MDRWWWVSEGGSEYDAINAMVCDAFKERLDVEAVEM